ncbi:MAG: helix-turn-helix domain-containing protein [Gammaproteobacteria bacterium]|jgi:transcriptional regulator with XRE-family HTH domain
MKITTLLTDDTILAEIGERISARRIELNMTQATVAKKAGMAKRTLERIEGGASAQMLSVIRIFRVLDLMDNLERMILEQGPKPMDILKQKRKIRVRASSKKQIPEPIKQWKWKEDE